MGPARKEKFKRRLYWQLAATFSGLVLLFSLSFMCATLLTLRNLLDRTLEVDYWNVAAELAAELDPYLAKGVDYAAVRKRLAQFKAYAPQFRVIFLDTNGAELDIHPIVPAVNFNRPFNVSQIEAALNDSAAEPALHYVTYERYGDVPFSAARITRAGQKGYLLVLLRLDDFSPNASLLFSTAGVPFGLLTLFVALVCGIGIGFFVFRALTTHFYQLLNTLRAYRDGDFSERAQIVSRNELGELSASVNEMADRIVANMAALKRKDEVRKELIANVAHDLRAPATGIIALTDTLLLRHKAMSDDDFYRCLNGIAQSGEALGQMISELFELSRLESSELELHKIHTPASEILEAAASRFQGTADRRNIVFEIQISDKLPEIYCDRFLIGRVIDNLLGNAIKFTSAGGSITLSGTHTDTGVEIAVSDTGSGIPEEDLSKIFDRFQQGAESNSNDQFGMGIGLAIVSAILRQHESTIMVQSEIGRGSRFAFRLQNSQELRHSNPQATSVSES